jgi:SAM-dependent methyltransferase
MGDHYYQNDKMEYQFASRFINDTDVVLDVGSGRGVFSKYIKGNYIGLDCNPTALEQARPGGIEVVNDSIEDHVHKIATLYSVVTAFQVIEHVAEPGKFIQFCLEALRPGGLLIVSVPSEESFVSLQENAVLNMPPHHVSRWSDGSLLSLGKLFNLTLIALEHEKLAGIHYEPYISLLSNITIRTLLKWDKGDMIDISLKKRIVDILSRFLKPLYRNVFRNNSLWPTGHSVTVIFRKQVSDETSQW